MTTYLPEEWMYDESWWDRDAAFTSFGEITGLTKQLLSLWTFRNSLEHLSKASGDSLAEQISLSRRDGSSLSAVVYGRRNGPQATVRHWVPANRVAAPFQLDSHTSIAIVSGEVEVRDWYYQLDGTPTRPKSPWTGLQSGDVVLFESGCPLQVYCVKPAMTFELSSEVEEVKPVFQESLTESQWRQIVSQFVRATDSPSLWRQLLDRRVNT